VERRGGLNHKWVFCGHPITDKKDGVWMCDVCGIEVDPPLNSKREYDEQCPGTAKMAIRGSASYEYEIDTLREALRDLLEVCDTSSSIGEYEHREDFEIRISAVRNARAAIERTDWRAE
jgi:hypothetical protein